MRIRVWFLGTLLLAGVSIVGNVAVVDAADPPAKEVASGKDDPTSKEAPLAKNLQVLSVALSKYMDAHHGVWPQEPAGLDKTSRENWWIKTLRPYGAEPQHWTDPADKANAIAVVALTSFDDLPNTAFRWPTQPWLIAKSVATGRTLALLPDGRVMETGELAKIAPTRKLQGG